MTVNDAPVLSIVTVCLNDLVNLRATVASVQAACVGLDIEHIIIDGGSTDGTREYLEGLNASHIRWVSEKDAGIFSAFNKGVEMAEGKWVHILNAGDNYFPTHFPSHVDLETSSNFICLAVLKRKKTDFVWLPRKNHVLGVIDVAHPGLIVRKDFYNSGNVFPLKWRYVSDSAFIWENVKIEDSDIYDDIFVDMADGGFSTKLNWQHEYELHRLIAGSQMSKRNKMIYHFKYFARALIGLASSFR